MAQLYINIAIVLTKQMRFDDAVRFLKSGGDYFVAIGDIRNAMTAYLNLGRVEQDRAEYRQSIAYFDQAIALVKENANFVGSYALLVYLKGNSLYDLKAIEEAQATYQEALALATLTDNVDMVSSIQNGMAAIKSYDKQFDEALAIYQANLQTFETTGNIEELIATYTNLGLLYDETGYFQDAYETYEKALEMICPYDLGYLEISILMNQAELLQNFLKYREALERLADFDNDDYLAKAYAKKGEEQKAIEHYKHSLKLGEDILLSRIDREELHLAHRINFEYTYQYLIELLLKTGEINEAYWYFERFKSQTFRKMLASNCEVEGYEALRFGEVKGLF